MRTIVALALAAVFTLSAVAGAQMARGSGNPRPAAVQVSLPELPPPPPMRLVVDGKDLTAELKPVLVDGRLLVPVRVVQHLTLKEPVELRWDDAGRYLAVLKQGLEIAALFPDTVQAILQGREEKLDAAPRVVDGRLLVPLRFIARVTGAGVRWDPSTRTVTVTSPNATLPKTIPLSREECRKAYAILELDRFYDIRNAYNRIFLTKEWMNDALYFMRVYNEAASWWGRLETMLMVACREWSRHEQIRQELMQEYPEVQAAYGTPQLGVGGFLPLMPPDAMPQYFTAPSDPDNWVGRPLTDEGCRFAFEKLSYGLGSHYRSIAGGYSEDPGWDSRWMDHYIYLTSVFRKICPQHTW